MSEIGRRAGGGVQLRKASPTAWTVERQQEFLAELAGTCNVTASARAAGVSEKTAYRRRALDPEFRAAWDAAQDQGYARWPSRRASCGSPWSRRRSPRGAR